MNYQLHYPIENALAPIYTIEKAGKVNDAFGDLQTYGNVSRETLRGTFPRKH